MAFIEALKSTKIEIRCLVGFINILVCNISSINIFVRFNSFIRFLRDLEFYLFLIPILVGLGLHPILFI